MRQAQYFVHRHETAFDFRRPSRFDLDYSVCRGTEVLTLLEEIAEYVDEQQETNVAGLLCYYRRESACASQKVTAKLVLARLDLVRARSNQHRYYWIIGMVNYIQEEGNDERQYGV